MSSVPKNFGAFIDVPVYIEIDRGNSRDHIDGVIESWQAPWLCVHRVIGNGEAFLLNTRFVYQIRRKEPQEK